MCGLRLLRSYICFATSQISLLTKQTNFNVCLSFARLLLLPTGTQYPAGSPKSLKSQNFDAIKPHKYTVSCGGPVTFLGKFLRGRVLWRT